MPTKTEQADLYQAVFGRHGEAPLPVLATATPNDGFATAIEAVRLATQYMTPVILLTDGYLVNAAEPWAIPDIESLPAFPVKFHAEPEGFYPFLRNADTLGRVWAIPGTPGLEHRIGGLEKDYATGHISYDSANHQRMTEVRAAKIRGIANAIPLQEVALGNEQGQLAVVGWGSTFGAVNQAVRRVRAQGYAVSHIHLRYLYPLPRNLGELLRGFEQVLVPELNSGQLLTLLRSEYLIPAEGFNQITGLPFRVRDIEHAIRFRLETL
jgi:2-oxoglutarate ferredoxin oxidoreductase subunit alpha